MIGLIELSTIKTVRICAIVVHYLILPVAYTTTYMLLKLQLKHKTMSCTIIGCGWYGMSNGLVS